MSDLIDRQAAIYIASGYFQDMGKTRMYVE